MNYIKNKFFGKMLMLYYDRTDVSEGIDINKTSVSKERDIRHFWYLFNKALMFQTYVCNGSHDFIVISINLSNTAILNVKSVDYRKISI